jgi:hypothetical protein
MTTQTIVERNADELLKELKEASRLLAAYSRALFDDGNKSQAEAIQRHNHRMGSLIRKCTVS